MTLQRRRHRRRSGLSQSLEGVLARLIEQTGKLYKTQAVKLPYLADVVALHVLGRKITESSYQAWDHGVVAVEVYDFITSARYGGADLTGTPFVVEEPRGYEDRQVIKLAGKSSGLLSQEETEIVDFVADEYGTMPPVKLGKITKLMNPHIKSWRSAKPVHVNEEAYEALPVGFDDADAEVAAEQLQHIDDDPDYLVTGDDLRRELTKILG